MEGKQASAVCEPLHLVSCSSNTFDLVLRLDRTSTHTHVHSRDIHSNTLIVPNRESHRERERLRELGYGEIDISK